MTDRSFLDTNILVYAYDAREPIKQARAREILKQGIEDETAVLSVQVIGEFFTVVTRRIPNPLSIEEAEEVLNLLGILPIIDLDFRMVRHAIEIYRQTALHTGMPSSLQPPTERNALRFSPKTSILDNPTKASPSSTPSDIS